MARNLDVIIDGVLLRLGMPRAQAPTREQALQQITTQIRTLLRSKQNVSNPWNYNETTVEITPGEAAYQVNAADFGTPLAVQTVPISENDVVRLIPFYCPQNMNFSYGYSVNAGNWMLWPTGTGSNCNALRCAFYWRGANAYIEFLPIPQLTPASYLIKYLCSANSVGQEALTATPLADQDVDLIEIRAAKGLLSNTEWESNITKDGRQINAEKRKDLMVTLSGDEALVAQQFDIANRITTGPRLALRWNCTTE